MELVDSVDELRSSSSTRGISMPNFEVLDARIASRTRPQSYTHPAANCRRFGEQPFGTTTKRPGRSSKLNKVLAASP